ncbi:MAG: CBS domain-containing protein [Nitrospinae bacterium]|nr:CBS domain-containing protein [Nitrospinota bacterium]MBL7019464.1 CBS domain-containing protein [Nitrospinaceae bacterium]
MPLIGRIALPAPTLDSKLSVSEAIEYLVINSCDHAFVQHEGEMIGIVSAERLLEGFKSQASATIPEFMGPIITIKDTELQARAAEIMIKNRAECVAVTNQNGVFVGVAAFKKLDPPHQEL